LADTTGGSSAVRVVPHDPSTLAGATGLLAVIAVLAGYLPARRAVTIDPIVAPPIGIRNRFRVVGLRFECRFVIGVFGF
jgi:hypothetical protein